MGEKTGIEWTDATWSPSRARVKKDAAKIARAKGYTSLVQIAEKMAGHVGPHCEKVSDGCGGGCGSPMRWLRLFGQVFRFLRGRIVQLVVVAVGM
jgi:hypothetical protein